MAIIFDLDGTLLDSIDDLGNAMNRVLRQYNLPEHDRSAYTGFVGNGMKKLVERAIPKNHPQHEEILAAYLAEYAHHYKDDSVLYPYVYATLKELNHRKVPIAICTNKKQEYTDNIVAHYFKGIVFEAVVGDQFDGKQKPDPYHALKVAKQMMRDAESIYFVGDSNVDMETALNAKMIPVGVSWGFRTVEELNRFGATRILHDFRDVLTLPIKN